MVAFQKFQNLKKDSSIFHFVTTRSGGVSQGKYSSLNLGIKAGDTIDDVLRNRSILAGEIGISTNRILFPDQCHTNFVQTIRPRFNENDLKESDGLITSEEGICLCVLSADCVSILLYDKHRKVISALHAGWKGTAHNIVGQAILKMKSEFGSEVKDIQAAIGPAISQKFYEVGPEVVNAFRKLFPDERDIFWKNPKTLKTHIDLQLANKILLQREGLRSNNMECMEKCTYDNPIDYFSARRDGYNCGRYATGIMLNGTA